MYNKIYHKKYIKKNKIKYLLYQEKYRANHQEQIKEYKKKYNKKHKKEKQEYNHKYYKLNKLKILKHNREWAKQHKNQMQRLKNKWQKEPKNRVKIRKYEFTRRRKDIQYKLLVNLRHRVYSALIYKRKKYNKSNSTIELLGCTIIELRKHLEKQFTVGMTWKNYGIKGWHIDHIIPCANFNLSKSNEQLQCFNYRNLQPLWAEENLRKG